MKIKWNWGWGILLSIAAFMIILIIIVGFMMTKEVDLVTDKYYDKEIKYQEQIEKEKRTLELNKKIEVINKISSLTIFFPEDTTLNGELHFYRPSDLHKDFKLPINFDSDFKQVLDISMLERGFWKLQISWSMRGKDYFTEKKMVLN